MRDEVVLTHKFVEYIPDVLEDRTVYVSMEYATVAHKCCCGCGRKVVTPLSPPSWKLMFDGESITLHPSIGSWNLPCRSHYWIRNNRAQWASQWSHKQIEAGRASEAARKQAYFNKQEIVGEQLSAVSAQGPKENMPKEGLWRKFKKLFH